MSLDILFRSASTFQRTFCNPAVRRPPTGHRRRVLFSPEAPQRPPDARTEG